MGGIPFFPTEASTITGQTDLITIALLGLSSVFTLIVMALIVYFSLKYRRGRQADRSNLPTAYTRIEMSWIGGLMFLSLGLFTWATLLFFRSTGHPRTPWISTWSASTGPPRCTRATLALPPPCCTPWVSSGCSPSAA